MAGDHLLGRAGEVSLVEECVAAAVGGRPQALLIEGEPGIGKTVLLEHAAHAAEAAGASVLRGRAEELDWARPFGPMADAVGIGPYATESDRTALWRVLIQDREDTLLEARIEDGPWARHLVIEGVVRLVEAVAVTRPVVLCLDDIQWADASTLLTVLVLTRRLAHLPVGVFAALRPSPSRPDVQRVVDELLRAGGRHLVLAALDDEAVGCLLERLTHAPGDARLLKWAEGAGGNPFYVTELVNALLARGGIELDGQRAKLVTADLPTSARRLLLRRLDELSPTTAEAVRVASVLGTRFKLEELASVVDREPAELVGELTSVLKTGLLTLTDSGLAFRHDLVRQAIYEDMIPDARASLHRRAATALADAGRGRLEVAKHVAMGVRQGDQAAVEWLAETARMASATAPATAVELLERAIEVSDPAAPGLDALLGDLALARLWAGRINESEQLARDALDRAQDPAAVTALRLALVSCLVAQCRPDDALAVFSPGPDLSSERGVELHATMAWVQLGAVQSQAARRTGNEALAAARQLGYDYAACTALGALCSVDLLSGRARAGLAMAAEGVGLAQSSPSRAADRFHVDYFLGYALGENDELDAAVATLRRGRQAGDRLGTGWTLAYYQAALALTQYLRGEWEEARAEASAGIALCQETGSLEALPCLSAVLALISVFRDELPEADATLTAAEGFSLMAFRMHWVPWARSLYAERSGSPEAGLDRLSEAWDASATMGIVNDLPHLGPDMVRLSMAVKRPELARQALEGVEEAAARMEALWAWASAHLCRGLVLGDPGALLESVVLARRARRPLLTAQCCEAAAATAQRTMATELLGESVQIYDCLEATRDAARVRASLRSLGVREGVSGSRPARPKTGWASLTDKERTVAMLVTKGMTNGAVAERLYLSPRTVESHLSRVFSKLGVSGRGELTARAAGVAEGTSPAQK